MTNSISQFFQLRQGETRTVLILGVVLLINSLATQVSSVVAVSGFLSEGGVNQLLIVLLIDMLLVLAVTGLQSLVIDRFDRIALVRWMCIVFALLFVSLRLLFAFGVPGWLNYSIMYLLSEQQWLFFPLIFWALAGDIFDTAQAKRLFPLIGSLHFAGKIIGLSIAAGAAVVFESRGIAAEELLSLNALLYLVAFVIATLGLGSLTLRHLKPQQQTLKETLTEGWEFVREVPAFRFLTLAMIALLSSDIIIEFRFLSVSDQTFTNPAAYQQFYSLFRLAVSILSFAIAGLIASRVIASIGLKNAFLIYPVVMFIAAIWMIFQTGIIGAIGAMGLMQVVRDTIDESSRKSFQSLVPDERRGRVSIFMDSYLLGIGTIFGCLVTGAIVIIGSYYGIPDYFYAYLTYVGGAALFAIWAIISMRKVYDGSLFNWRLKRRQRGASVLDKLEF